MQSLTWLWIIIKITRRKSQSLTPFILVPSQSVSLLFLKSFNVSIFNLVTLRDFYNYAIGLCLSVCVLVGVWVCVCVRVLVKKKDSVCICAKKKLTTLLRKFAAKMKIIAPATKKRHRLFMSSNFMSHFNGKNAVKPFQWDEKA